MTYYELVEKNFGNRSNIVPATKVTLEPRHHKAFVSLFGYGKQIKEWLKLNDSVKGYEGEFHLRTLYFDIDRDNLEEARKDTLNLLAHFYKRFGIKPDELLLFFSGGKGFHIGVPDKLFGGFAPSSNLPNRIDKLASKMAHDKIEGVDTTIYNANRLFRLPNSKHGDSGLYKVPLYVEEIKEGIEKVKEIAQEPRTDFAQRINLNDIVLNEKLESIWEQSKRQANSSNSNTPTDSLSDGDFFKPPKEGERNNTLFKQSAMLFDKGLDTGNVYDIISSINENADPPLPEDEVHTIVKSACDKTGGASKPDKKLEDIHIVQDMVPTYMDYLSPSRRKLGLLFNEFSEDMKWKLRGKLIGVVGREGTKKSIFCQNVAYHNMRKFGARTIISNMEMGENPLMSRLADRSFQKYKLRPSEDMEQAMEEGNKSWVKQRLHLLSKHYNDKLIVSSSSAMTPKDYRQLVRKTEARYGKVDMLVVDGFSMMGGATDRFSRQENNSRELKEIAKEKDISIMAIFHTNAQAEKYYRKAHEYIRGTNKQKDNVDCFISMSMIVDQGKSTSSQDLYYKEDKGYSLMYNKRGSGRTIRKIFDFEPPQLKMVGTNENPNKYEVDVNRI